jgi:hypothetical protein
MKAIVTTTINPPTKALKKFSEMSDYHLIVVGDLKTPQAEYSNINCTYLDPEKQGELYPKLSELLGWNTIDRRNIGFLHALEMGAETIATVDDDNVPKPYWGHETLVGKSVEMPIYKAELVFDPVSVTNHKNLWHRGFPIQLLSTRFDMTSTIETVQVDVEAQFWDGDPDIDAICRMEHSPNCEFDPSVFPFSTRSLSPFNSQNTFLTRAALREYFMFPFIGRMDDIWGAYLLKALGFNVAFTKASVVQERNLHDLTKDFELEIDGYLRSYDLCKVIEADPESLRSFVPERSWQAYLEYISISRAL